VPDSEPTTTRASNTASPRRDAAREFLREETTGGKLLLLATAIALLWANLASGSYDDVWASVPLGGWADSVSGPLRLDIDLAHWAADGLLAIFFFVAGLEVKREFVVGELAERRAAMLPLAAALGGVLLPAAVMLAASAGAGASDGAWAIPVATDIAFALGVLAIAGSRLPSGVRVLLLSMAVIDDLIAIALIAILFTKDFSLVWMFGGIAACGVWALMWLLPKRPPASVLWAIAIVAWVCIHGSGIHATVTGVVLGLLVPVRSREDEKESPGEHLEHRFHPWSAGFAVPAFALAATGIPLAAASEIFSNDIARGALLGLLIGKFVGVLGGAWLAIRSGVGVLPGQVRWADLVPVALLAGIGYTVSLLITELALTDPADQDSAAAAVLVASIAASVAAAGLLRWRTRRHQGPEAPRGLESTP
jgi:NhaA family Na+:H+ antiporter